MLFIRLNTVNKQTGFTLIELLVVIGIIGVLATGVVALINPVLQFQRAHDAQRKSDLRQLQGAMELYRADYGFYPTIDMSGGSWNCSSVSGNNPVAGLDSAISNSVYFWYGCLYAANNGGKSYLSSPLHDPLVSSARSCNNGGSSPQGQYYIAVSPNGYNYTLYAHLENTKDPDAASPSNLKLCPAVYVGSGGCNGSTSNFIATQGTCGGTGNNYNYWVNNP